MTITPYIPMGDRQTASVSDLASAIMDIIDELALTDSDFEKVHEALVNNNVSYEVK